MRCPKCGYNSFDHLDSCKKCGKDLVEFKQNYGIKSVLFPGQMSATGVADNVEYDNDAADAAVSVATGTAVVAENTLGKAPMTDEADGDDFGFDFMGDSAEDDDLSFDELFEEAPEDEDIEETIEAPKEKAADPEPEGADEFSFDLPEEEAELEDDFGFDPADDASDSVDENDFSFDDDPKEVSKSESSGTEEGPERPFDLPESPRSVEAPEADLKISTKTSVFDLPVEGNGAASEVNVDSLASEDVEEVYILEAEEIQVAPVSAEHFQPEAFQDDPVLDTPVLPLPKTNLAGEVLPAVEAIRTEDVETNFALPRPALGSCVVAFILDVALLTIVGISFVVAAEAAMSTEKTRLLPSLETLIDLSVPYFLVLFFLAFGYFTLFHFLAGQTPGKMLVGLRVEATDGEPLVFSQAFLRSVGGLLQLIPVGLGYLLILANAERRGWNDRLAGTRVIALRDLPLKK